MMAELAKSALLKRLVEKVPKEQTGEKDDKQRSSALLRKALGAKRFSQGEDVNPQAAALLRRAMGKGQSADEKSIQKVLGGMKTKLIAGSLAGSLFGKNMPFPMEINSSCELEISTY